MHCTSSHRGVTVLELLIVITILAILVAVVLSPFLAFRQNALLNTETQETITLINKARLSSMSSKGDQQYGIHFEAGKVALFAGTTYVSGAATNEEYIFDSALTLGTITLNGGGSEILFQRITGAADKNGTTTLNIIGSTTASSTIVIRPSGIVTVY